MCFELGNNPSNAPATASVNEIPIIRFMAILLICFLWGAAERIPHPLSPIAACSSLQGVR
jgi:hypothetical protein